MNVALNLRVPEAMEFVIMISTTAQIAPRSFSEFLSRFPYFSGFQVFDILQSPPTQSSNSSSSFRLAFQCSFNGLILTGFILCINYCNISSNTYVFVNWFRLLRPVLRIIFSPGFDDRGFNVPFGRTNRYEHYIYKKN